MNVGGERLEQYSVHLCVVWNAFQHDIAVLQ